MAILQENEKGAVYRIMATITLEYSSEEMARSILKSVEADNYNFMDCGVDGKRIKCEVKARSVTSLLHTIDDFLACVILAEEVYRNI